MTDFAFQASADVFEPIKGGTIEVETTGGSVALTVERVSRLSGRTTNAEQDDRPRLDPFAIELSGPDTVTLNQGTYRMSHADLGSFELFLTRYKQDAGRNFYEVIFN